MWTCHVLASNNILLTTTSQVKTNALAISALVSLNPRFQHAPPSVLKFFAPLGWYITLIILTSIFDAYFYVIHFWSRSPCIIAEYTLCAPSLGMVNWSIIITCTLPNLLRTAAFKLNLMRLAYMLGLRKISCVVLYLISYNLVLAHPAKSPEWPVSVILTAEKFVTNISGPNR